jgi:hypothetical protein
LAELKKIKIDLANRIKITFPTQPSNFYLMSFSVYNTSLPYTQWISKQFITGTPTASNHIKIGTTLAETMNNILTNLNAYNLDGNASYELGSAGVFYVNLAIVENYSVAVLTAPLDTITTFETENVTVPDNDTLPDLDIKHFQILIYDTYVNDLPLILEFAKENSCKIKWDGGDDLYKSIMASNLVFDMLVANFEDAHFKHLFTGDEQRYRIELNAISETEVVQLIWQGFLLPDQYSERYSNSNLFVDFSATDMVSSMKGKYFKPWYYNNRLPIAEVIALALQNTGLLQNLIVKPVLVPALVAFEWQTINVDMRDFLDNGKYKDCYSIVESILKSQGLTLYSFRGYWWLEGCSRKHEITTTALQFDPYGKRIVDIDLVKREVDAFMQAEAPVLTAITPWRAVNLNFKVNGSQNLFSEKVVKIPISEQFYSHYNSIGYTGVVTPAFELYGVVKLNNWLQNLNNEFKLPTWWNSFSAAPITENYAILYWTRNYLLGSNNPYNYNEAAVLNRWIECPENPFVKSGVLYEFDLQFTIYGLVVYLNENTFKQKLEEGYYDRLLPFQVFINNIEKFSNRPSFSSTTNLRYEISDSDNGNGVHITTFKLKFNFSTDIQGQLKFRILMPINQESLGGLNNISFDRFVAERIKLTAIEGYVENDDVIAIRNINYTQELDHTLDLTCTVDKSVINSFGLGFPINANYFKTIDRTLNNADIITHHYFAPNVMLDLVYNKWDVPASLIELLFGKEVIKSCFLENIAGESVPFSDLWYFINQTNSKIGYLKSFTGFPIIPKKYKAHPYVINSDVLKYMLVDYANENFENRLNWKLVGSSVVDSYPKTLARALHGVQPEQLYRLEATQLGIIFPNDLLNFYFDNESRNFIPTRIDVDLFNAKSNIAATEAKFVELEDITYE